MKNIIQANKELNEWCGTEGINYYEGDSALGFLLEYAVPKLDKVTKWNVLYRWVLEICRHKIDPALVLFWALYAVVVKEKNNG